MKQKRKVCRIACLLCVSILCSSRAYAGAIQDRIDSTGERIDELENVLEQTEQNISAWEKEQRALEQEIAVGQEKISQLSDELDHTKTAIKDTQKEIRQTQKALEQSKKDSKKQYEQMKQRIRFMYENSTNDMLIYILEAGSMPEALRRANYFQAVFAYDRAKLQEFKATTKRIGQAKNKLVKEKDHMEALEEKQTGQLADIDQAVADLKQKLGSKLAQINNSKALKEKYGQELERQKQYEQELERQKAEEDLRREEEIRRQEEELRQKREEEERRRREQQRRQEQDGSSSTSGSSGGGNAGRGSTAASAGDLELLSTIIYCEAGNQSYEGQLAVGSVIMNRVASGSFPNSISGVIYQSGQFSPVASGRFAHALASGLGSRCRAAAQEVLGGRRNVDCLYFRVNNGIIDGIVIGDHVFY